MKAVIMAGGKGTRLRPLTNEIPKPLVPLCGKPVMEYAIDLARNHGVTDIAVTVQYLPEKIISYFGEGYPWGVRLNYYYEEEPLGTAGSVKNAEQFLSETFIVLSGDGLTDLDLSGAIRFHKSRRSIATLVLTEVEDPTGFGIVVTNQKGRITRFLEKPKNEEIFTNTINTGIYIFEPEIFKYIPQGTFYDFGKNVFPKLLMERAPFFGYRTSGYWSDIGTLEQYYKTNQDILERKVQVGRQQKLSLPS